MTKKILTILIVSAMNAAWADNPDALDDIIITATRSEINTAEAPSSVTVITRKQIAQKAATNIADILRGTTGVTLQGIGTGGRKAISLRGMESKHTLILINGKRVPSSNDAIGPNTDYQYDWIPIDNIERVEVVRGPMSVLYGADALGGVINIITRKPSKKSEGSLTLSGLVSGSNGHNMEFSLSGSMKPNVQLGITAQENRRESLPSILKIGQSAIEGHKNQQLSANLDWQPAEKHNINIEVNKGQEDRWYNTQTRRRVLYQSQYRVTREQASLGWKGPLGPTTSSLRAYQSTIDITNKAIGGGRATAPQNLKETTFEGNSRFSKGEKHFFTVGFQHRKETLKNARLVGGQDDATLKSLYLQDEIDLNDNLVLTLGARLDKHNVFGSEVSPRASIVWNANDHLTLKGSYGHGFHAPTIKQSSGSYIFTLGRIKVTGNPSLKPETNNALELGANYSKNNYSIDFALFDNNVKNLIALTGPITDRTYKNVSQAHLKGAEISHRFKLKEGLKLNTSYQYLDAKDGDGNRLKHRPRHTLSSGLTWDKNKWKWNINAEYVSGQIIEHNNVSTDVPGYTIWNAGMQKTISKHINVSIKLDNVTDVRLEEKSSAFLHEEQPRTLTLGIHGRF